MPRFTWKLLLARAAAVLLTAGSSATIAAPEDWFGIHVVDEASGHGVPLITLETTNHIRLVTDSAGWVAFQEPGLMNVPVFFTVTGPGYAHAKDGFGYEGETLTTTPGKTGEIKVMRTNIAERVCRLTGQGIYRDSTLLGLDVPLPQPNLSSGVMGQDSVNAVEYRGELFWLWGDTQRASHPLGNFYTTCATSKLPSKGGLDPSMGVHLRYFEDENGTFTRKMAPLEGPGVVWLDGLLTVKDKDGEERLLAHYSRMKDLGTRLEHGIMEFDDDQGLFVPRVVLGEEFGWQCPRGHVVKTAVDGREWFYFANPFCNTRVPATYDDVMNPSSYEALVWSEADGSYSWAATGEPMEQEVETHLVQKGDLPVEKTRYQVKDATTGKDVRIHAGSIHWNEWRKRWILLAVQNGAKESLLGEVWYAEAVSVDGPWSKAVKVASHPKYSFYNPCHHPFFDQEEGRIIYFEGTYAETFSGAPVATARYDYNQVLYRLDLGDARLKPAQP